MVKEMTDALRDRRSIYTMLCISLLGPLMLPFLFNQLSKQQKAAEEMRLPVVGRALAPALMNWLEKQNGVEVVPGPTDPEAAVRRQDEDIVLVITPELGGDFAADSPAAVRVVLDSTREFAPLKLMRLQGLLDRFSTDTAHSRQILRGVSPEVIAAIDVQQIDVANPQQRAAKLLDFILMFVAMSILVAGTEIATDSTAGERERGSLEPLLLNPVPRWQLATGKWLASVVGALIGLIATLMVCSLILAWLPVKGLGIRLHLGLSQWLLLVAAMGPLALIAPAVQIYLSCFAKSFREAQSYILIMVLPVTAVGSFAILYPLAKRPWVATIPVLAQFSLGTEIVSGNVPSAAMLILAALAGAAFAGLFLWFTTRLLSTEKIIFGR
jgi:sodium transport system permease protein